jgi:hypothetical protein
MAPPGIGLDVAFGSFASVWQCPTTSGLPFIANILREDIGTSEKYQERI